MLDLLRHLNLKNRLFAGFAVMVLLILVMALNAIWQANSAAGISTRVQELRVPTAMAGMSVLNGVNHALAALRGWMLLGKDKFKQERANAWSDEINAGMATLNEKSVSWTNPENIERLKKLQELLLQFADEQKKIEDIAQTPDNIPALKILLTEAAPKAGVMTESITKMIDAELELEATAERKALLGMMADVRGSLGLALANIRAFLLSGEDHFRTTFESLWAKNDKRFADLQRNSGLLTSTQRDAFKLFADARSAFAPLPEKMLALRSGEDWNLANHWLATKAAPLGFQIKEILNALTSNQTQLLEQDSNEVVASADRMQMLMLTLLVVSVILASAFGYFISKSIIDPVNALKEVMMRVERDADLTLSAKCSGKDEVTAMAHAFNTMLDNINSLISSIAASSAQVSSAAEEMAAVSMQSKQGISKQLVETEQVATAMNEMNATVHEVAKNAAEASSAAKHADDETRAGNRVVAEVTQSIRMLADEVQRTAETIHALEAEAENIGSVVDVIRGIAEQTNLLALNAAIEAARAGEQGRGFAVVADEVRTLASRTQESTQEIQAMILRLQEGAKSAVQAMDQGRGQADRCAQHADSAANALEGIAQAVSQINQMNIQIASAGEEQSAVAEEINRNIVAINTISNETFDGAKQTEGASEELSSLANNLQAMVRQFKTA